MLTLDSFGELGALLGTTAGVAAAVLAIGGALLLWSRRQRR
jgi:hypothetical protein